MSGRPVQTTTKVTTAGAAYVEVDFPDPAIILQVHVAGSSAFNCTIYNRQIVGAALGVEAIREDADSGNVLVIMEAPHNFAVGDSVVMAASGTVGYNVTHVIASVTDDAFVSDQAHTVDELASPATATFTLPTAERPAYEVLELTAAVTNVVRFNGTRVFRSEQIDPSNVNRPQGKLYVLLSDVDTYVISVRGEQATP